MASGLTRGVRQISAAADRSAFCEIGTPTADSLRQLSCPRGLHRARHATPLALALALALSVGIACGVLIDAQSTVSLPLRAGARLGGQRRSPSFRGWPRRPTRRRLWSPSSPLAGCSARTRSSGRCIRRCASVLEQRIGGFAIDGSADRHDVANRHRRPAEPGRGAGRRRASSCACEVEADVGLAVPGTRLAGGVSLSVGGEQQAAHLAEWRRGRVIRAPALLRRPARYLNDGVPDQERALARRGIALVGNVKSAALVEVSPAAGGGRRRRRRCVLAYRAALARHVEAARRAERSRLPPRFSSAIAPESTSTSSGGLQEAGTYHVIAISGGNIAILAGLQLGILAWLGHSRMARAAGHGRLCSIGYAAVAVGGASVARATADGVRLPGCAARSISARRRVTRSGWPVPTLLLHRSAGDCRRRVLADVRRDGGDRGRRVACPAARSIVAASAVAGGAAGLRVCRAGPGADRRAGVSARHVGRSAAQLRRASGDDVGADSARWRSCSSICSGSRLPLAGSLGIVVHAGSEALTESARFLDFAPWLTWRVPSPRSSSSPRVLPARWSSRWARQRLPRRRAVDFDGCRLPRPRFSSSVIVAAPQARIRAPRRRPPSPDADRRRPGRCDPVTFPNGRRLVVDTGGASGRGDFDIGDRVVGPTLSALGVLEPRLSGGHARRSGSHRWRASAGPRLLAARDLVGCPGGEPRADQRLRAEADRMRATWRMAAAWRPARDRRRRDSRPSSAAA